jgi:hypothetical protein
VNFGYFSMNGNIKCLGGFYDKGAIQMGQGKIRKEIAEKYLKEDIEEGKQKTLDFKEQEKE